MAFQLDGRPLRLKADFGRIDLERFVHLRVKWTGLTTDDMKALARHQAGGNGHG